MPDGQNGLGLYAALKSLVDSGLGYIWLIFLAVWGGTVNYLNRLKKSQAGFSVAELAGEWVISGFAGIMTAFICFEMGFSDYVTYAAAGISGHMGGKAVYFLEKWFNSKLPG